MLGSLQQATAHKRKYNANKFPDVFTAGGVVGRDWFLAVRWLMFTHHREISLGA